MQDAPVQDASAQDATVADASTPIDATAGPDAQTVDFCSATAVRYPLRNATARFFFDSNGVTTQETTIPIVVSASETSTGLTNPPWMDIVERPGGVGLSFREVTISRSPCNFSNSPEYRVASFADQTFSFRWTVAINDTTRAATIPRLTTGTWYINVRNQSCNATMCDYRFEYQGLR